MQVWKFGVRRGLGPVGWTDVLKWRSLLEQEFSKRVGYFFVTSPSISNQMYIMHENWIELGTQSQESISKDYETISKVLNCRWPGKGRCKCMTLHMNNHEYGCNMIEWQKDLTKSCWGKFRNVVKICAECILLSLENISPVVVAVVAVADSATRGFGFW